VPPSFVSFYPREASVSYPEDSSMNLFCHAFAIPPVNITWIYRQTSQLSKGTRRASVAPQHVSRLVLHEGETLSVSALKSFHAGSYECIASNGYHGSISRSFYVTVQCKCSRVVVVVVQHRSSTRV
jgi:hypothetical protein